MRKKESLGGIQNHAIDLRSHQVDYATSPPGATGIGLGLRLGHGGERSLGFIRRIPAQIDTRYQPFTRGIITTIATIIKTYKAAEKKEEAKNGAAADLP